MITLSNAMTPQPQAGQPTLSSLKLLAMVSNLLNACITFSLPTCCVVGSPRLVGITRNMKLSNLVHMELQSLTIDLFLL